MKIISSPSGWSHVFSLWIFLASSLWAGGPSAQAAECDLKEQFRKAVLETFGNTVALSKTSFALTLIERDGGEILCSDSLQGNQELYPASSIKTLIAIATLRKVDRGELAMSDSIKINQVNAARECADWGCSVYGPGKSVSIEKLIFDMITVSNNLATNQLIDVAGRQFINETADLLEASSLRVYRKMYNIQDPEPDVSRRNTATANGLNQLYREISTGRLKVLEEKSRLYLIEVLNKQVYHDGFNALFPKNLFYFHKPGATSRSLSDGGFFYWPENERIIVLLSGIEGFTSYQRCENCPAESGLKAFQTLGKKALQAVHTVSP